jgi:hypothetical protein
MGNDGPWVRDQRWWLAVFFLGSIGLQSTVGLVVSLARQDWSMALKAVLAGAVQGYFWFVIFRDRGLRHEDRHARRGQPL